MQPHFPRQIPAPRDQSAQAVAEGQRRQPLPKRASKGAAHDYHWPGPHPTQQLVYLPASNFLFFIFWVQVKPEAGAHFILVPLVPFCSYPLLLYVSCVSCMPVSVSLSVSVQVHQWSQAHFDESGQ